MFENFLPTSDRLLIKRINNEEKTEGGIILPEAGREKPQIGSVLAAGPGRRDASGMCIPMDVKVGDAVYFGKYAGTEIDGDHLIIREDEILGIINN